MQIGKPSIRHDPADERMVLVDFPLSEPADAQWMSLFATHISTSSADAWTVTGQSVRLRSNPDPDELRTGMAELRRVVAQTTADYHAAVAPATAGDVSLDDLRRVVDEEFGPG